MKSETFMSCLTRAQVQANTSRKPRWVNYKPAGWEVEEKAAGAEPRLSIEVKPEREIVL